jgi:hypothetical protein
VDSSEGAEDTFVHHYLSCYLDNIFSTETLFYQAWCDIYKVNNSTDKLRPDWTLYVKPWFTRFDLTSCKVKTPKTVGRDDISDFVMISQELDDIKIKVTLFNISFVFLFTIYCIDPPPFLTLSFLLLL